ncbi:MAG: tRNA (adenosine(37)-N6)-dimethylallyltransferase MiaA [Clostridiales bacterium]|jgi:tRNA dimethylallyltransferase|nr:tRNA (adenosine(37)-N6)-dimethylallyltransferase MiaA [Clostridiales bacterium]
MHKPYAYVLVGPTAVGKTSISIKLAQLMDAEIVSADSIQVYQGLDIGAAKPGQEEREGVPHHMLDIIGWEDGGFSVSVYQRMAYVCVRDILARGVQPLVVGGTGLYIQALTHPLHFANIPADEAVRAELAALEAGEPGAVYAMLQSVDPITAGKLHPNDKKRVIRAVEVYKLAGKPMSDVASDIHDSTQTDVPYNFVCAGLTLERTQLYDRIEKRVDDMMQNGLLQECEKIFSAKPGFDLPALQGLGYKQLLQYMNNACTLEQAVYNIKLETRRYAKRQLTWFRRHRNIRWFEADSPCVIQDILEYYQGT